MLRFSGAVTYSYIPMNECDKGVIYHGPFLIFT